jgi:hypothetical protein
MKPHEIKAKELVEKKEDNICNCDIPYFPTGNIHFCSKCSKQTIY